MAKRARGSVRPGQRRPVERRHPSSASAPKPATPKPIGLSEAEVARAAELEAQMLAEERAAEEARRRTKDRAATRELASAIPAGSLAAQEAREYAYVARDIKDIVRIAALLLGILFGLWILIDVTGIISLG